MSKRLHYLSEYKIKYSENSVGKWGECDNVIDILSDVCPDFWQCEDSDSIAECPKECWQHGIGVLENMTDVDFQECYGSHDTFNREILINFMKDALENGEKEIDYIRLQGV